MAENFGGFDNRFLMLLNALPSVTVEQLHQKARVRMRRRNHAKREVFALDLQYGGGEDHKTSTLLPGKSMRVDERFGRQIAENFKPQAGLCACEPGLAVFKDDSERQEAILQALQNAEEHYHICGAQQLDGVRNSRGHRDDEVERLRDSVYSTYFLAMAKEELIREHRMSLENKAKKAS